MLRLQKKLGYVFKNTALLKQALTHRSADKLHNERLELLGDAVLNFVITREIYNRFPDADEGNLSQIRSGLICRQTLAELASTFFDNNDLVLGKGEKNGDFRRNSIISDALEALIGAIYLDCQHIEIIQKLIIGWYEMRLTVIQQGYREKEAKTQLQEYLQSIYKKRPVYTILVTEGRDHEKKFVVQCYIPHRQEKFIGEGMSKRKAEQAAAKQAIDYLKLNGASTMPPIGGTSSIC